MQTDKIIKIMLVGNPNSGKTTLFNQLTGSHQHTGNRAGVTVDKKSGKVNLLYYKNIEVIDLPGIYSLSPYSEEEIIAHNSLINDKPDIIINIVDATNLERNLYLTTQLSELDIPIVIALNMYDIFERNCDIINLELLEKYMKIPIIPISATKNTGITKLIDKALSTYGKKTYPTIKFKHNCPLQNPDHDMIIANARYSYIHSAVEKCLTRRATENDISLSDKIDRVVTNRFFAYPCFIIIILAIFVLTFGNFGTTCRNGAEFLINDIIGINLRNFLNSINTAPTLVSLIIDGIVAGTGSVISFLPQITILFAMLSLLEDSGYMARAVFIMDKPLRSIGLSGKAFVPLLMGFGCTVPAVLSARTLENKSNKQLALLITPFMSCSAKMPVYLLLCSTIFKKYSVIVISTMYLTGIIIAIITALIFKSSANHENTPFIMELPPYRFPSPKNLILHIRSKVKDFLYRAGTVLLIASIIIWFLQSFDFSFNMVSSEESILADIGKLVAPIFTLCGFGNWRATVSLLIGITAKENIASTLSMLYSTGGIADAFTPASAFSFMLFVLLYTPCIAAVSAIHKELGSIKLTIKHLVFQVFIAWLLSALFFQITSIISNFL